MRSLVFLVMFLALITLLGVPACANEKNSLQLEERWIGDYDGMVSRHMVRVLVVYNRMFYFIDRGHLYGETVELCREFEKFINKKIKSDVMKIRVVFVPVTRDELIPSLVKGRGDIAIANLTITPERKKTVDFSQPFRTGVKEILITGPSAPDLITLEDLAGKELHLRLSSSYHEHVVALNSDFEHGGKKPIKIIPASEYLEDSDLFEMANADLIPMFVADLHKAEFWSQIFENVSIHPDITIHQGGEIAWSFRKKNPKLNKIVNEFVEVSKKGTLLGNILNKRYLKDNKWARNALNANELEKFNIVVDLFKKYSNMYSFDYLMIGALAYQESRLDHSKRSAAGAVGIMQVLPKTAAGKRVDIPDIENLENNIHAGHKYLRFLKDHYFSDPGIDALNSYLFTFAAYNAGPARVTELRREARKHGLDPNVWFQNVEVIAAEHIGKETVQYVRNIYKYYLSYRLLKTTEESIQKLEVTKS
jgi:membrane-bound lytic murein transglycosylase MltF